MRSGVALIITCLSVSLSIAYGQVEVRCLAVGQEEFKGRLQELQGGKLVLAAGQEKRALPLGDLQRIEFVSSAKATGQFTWKAWGVSGDVYLLQAMEKPDPKATALSVRGEGWRAENFKLARILGVASREFLEKSTDSERERFDTAMRQMTSGAPPPYDLLLVTTGARADILQAQVLDVGPEGIRANFGGRERTLPWARIRWAALRAESKGEAAQSGYRLHLADGSVISASELSLQGDRLVAAGSAGEFQVELSSILRFDVFSPRYQYLSKLKPDRTEITPFFDVGWPPQFDRSVTGEPIVLGGRTYDYGIGAGTRTEITYQLGGRYAYFYATAGVDSSAGDRGQVVFRLMADAREVFRSAVLSGASQPVKVAVPMKGVQTLTLISDFGSDVRAEGNFADWADARLVAAQPSGS